MKEESIFISDSEDGAWSIVGPPEGWREAGHVQREKKNPREKVKNLNRVVFTYLRIILNRKSSQTVDEL